MDTFLNNKGKLIYKGSRPTGKKSGFTRLPLRILVAGERFNTKSSHRLPNISRRIQRSKQRILPSPPWVYKDAGQYKTWTADCGPRTAD